MTTPSKPVHKPNCWPQRLAAALLLLALPCIGLSIYFSRVGRNTSPRPAPAGSPAVTDLLPLLPRPNRSSAFTITTSPRQWPADKMYEKINGEDEAYLKHGCVALAAMTLTDKASGATVDIYLYRMATPAAARAVFEEQAPPADTSQLRDRPRYVDIGDKAYTSWGCYYVRAGEFYLKLIASDQAGPSATQAARLAIRFEENVRSTVAGK